MTIVSSYNVICCASARKAIIEELAGLGASVYTCARTGARLEECLKQCKEAGLKVEGSVCDVTSREARIKLIQDVSLHFGKTLDILVSIHLSLILFLAKR